MKLVGDVKCELEDQSKRLEFLGELEDLMMRYQISTVNVAWAFGTRWDLAQAEEQPFENGGFEPPEKDTAEKVVPRNVAISPIAKITPRKAGFRQAGVTTPAGVDVGERENTTEDKVAVLANVVGKMESEEAENRGEVGPEKPPEKTETE